MSGNKKSSGVQSIAINIEILIFEDRSWLENRAGRDYHKQEVRETINTELTAKSSQLNCKLMRTRFQSTTALRFIKSRYHSEVHIQTITVEVFIEKSQGGNFTAVGK